MKATKNFKYIEIKQWGDGGIVKRMDVTGKTERIIDKIESGVNRNLNHDEYYTTSFDSNVELDEIE